MMTIVTEITIEPGQETAWDEAYRERLDDAPNQEGWISTQLLIPLDAPNKRLVVGTWRTRADWEAWHTTDTFERTRERLNAVKQTADPERWYEVVTMASQEG
jgi:heme-degrading monooxygenase HmoA